MPVDHIDDAAFEERAVGSPTLAVVDFYTTWCGPCKILSPTLEELSTEYGEAVRFLKIDAEESPETTRRFDVKGYPTVVMLKDGEEVGRFSGSWPRREVRRRVDACLGRAAPEQTAAEPETVSLPPAVDRLVQALKGLDQPAWFALHDQLDQAAAVPPTAAETGEDRDSLTAMVSWVSNEVDDLAALHFSDDLTLAVTSAAVPAFMCWMQPAANAAQRIAAAPVAALIHNQLPSDRAEAPAAFVATLRELTTAQWSELGRQVLLGTSATAGVHQLGQDGGQLTDHWRAWFAAASLAKAIATREILDPVLYDEAWTPLSGVLDRQVIELD